ncbi:MAG: hypothetical protein M1822_008134 [Bathelium mastoideum]|nr:MAG: hypothetical protein M1822_008134 [Bathelium mastoideum]
MLAKDALLLDVMLLIVLLGMLVENEEKDTFKERVLVPSEVVDKLFDPTNELIDVLLNVEVLLDTDEDEELAGVVLLDALLAVAELFDELLLVAELVDALPVVAELFDEDPAVDEVLVEVVL